VLCERVVYCIRTMTPGTDLFPKYCTNVQGSGHGTMIIASSKAAYPQLYVSIAVEACEDQGGDLDVMKDQGGDLGVMKDQGGELGVMKRTRG
jgi:hypothetical protein